MKPYLIQNIWGPGEAWINILQNFNLSYFFRIILCLCESISRIRNEYFISFSHLALHRRHNVEMTRRGGTDTIWGGMEWGRSKYSIRVLAGADDNLGPNLR